MKKTLPLVLLVFLVAGCNATKFAMQKGDRFVGKDVARADAFRDFTGNDQNRYGHEWVIIDQPTYVYSP